MRTDTHAIRIRLTPEQREQIRQATGKETPTLKLQLAALEARLAPGLSAQ